MKNKSLRFILCAVMVTMALAFTACGGSDDAENAGADANVEADAEADADANVEADAEADEDANVEADAEAEAEADAEPEANAAASGKFANMSDFVNSEEMQSQMDSLVEQLEGTGMNIEILGEDNKLIYRYTFGEIANEEGLADALAAEMEGQESTFVAVASACKLAVDIENPVVVVEYLDMNGEVIFSQEFPAE